MTVWVTVKCLVASSRDEFIGVSDLVIGACASEVTEITNCDSGIIMAATIYNVDTVWTVYCASYSVDGWTVCEYCNVALTVVRESCRRRCRCVRCRVILGILVCRCR